MASARRTHNLDNALGILDDAMEDALTLGGKILQQRMQERAPVDTGRMTRSVKVAPVEKSAEGYRTSVGPDVDYAKYTELEPWIIGKRPGPKSQIKGASIPWMRPAADETREDIQDFITTAIRTTIRALERRAK